ncbi:F-type H+-transporting ATPase subunit delta [Clostridiales Family XIII bacterium PM5-7]
MELIVGMTYGKALFDAAMELDKIEQIKEEIVGIEQILKKEQDYFSLLTNPAIPEVKKKLLIRNVFEDRVCPEVLSFLLILIAKGRMGYFRMITKEYIRLMDNHLRIAEGVIYSAVPLSTEQMNKFQEEAGKLLDEKIELRNVIDEKLLGGVKLLVEGKLIDASLRGRLNDLQNKLRNI